MLVIDMTVTKPEGPKRVRNMHIVIPQELHQKVKMMCVIKDVTLREFTETALKEKLERDEKGLGQ